MRYFQYGIEKVFQRETCFDTEHLRNIEQCRSRSVQLLLSPTLSTNASNFDPYYVQLKLTLYHTIPEEEAF